MKSEIAMRMTNSEGSGRNENCDVVVLGAGLMAGSISAILAKNKVKVIMLDSSCHPKFAIGEALVPESSLMFKLLGAKYDIPEFTSFSSHYRITDEIGPTHGLKRALSTVYHSKNGSVDIIQIPAISPPLGPDAHLFRQDCDAFICNAALRYGAEVRVHTKVTRFDISEQGAVVHLANGDTISGKFIVDAGGERSELAQHLQARQLGELATNSRTIFTHMVDVAFIDNLIPDELSKTYDFLLSQSTLHHIFDGGWLWIIPFNNHYRATNSVCSVGLVLDAKKFPYTGMDAEEEFNMFIDKIDMAKRQLSAAKAVRPWITSKTSLQYTCKEGAVGYRTALLGPAASFVDPLFSPGINTSLVFVDGLASKLLDAIRQNDFCPKRFTELNDNWANTNRMWDKMIHASYIAFRHIELWDAWFKFWNMFAFTGNVMLSNIIIMAYQKKDKSIFNMKQMAPFNGPFGSKLPPCAKLFEEGYAVMLAVEANNSCPIDAANKIRDMMDGQSFFPFPEFFGRDPKHRSLPTNTLYDLLRQVVIYKAKLPAELRPYLVGYSTLAVIRWGLREIWHYPARKIKNTWVFIKDVFVPDKVFARKMQSIRAASMEVEMSPSKDNGGTIKSVYQQTS